LSQTITSESNKESGVEFWNSFT